jgi:hypothetical protein
VADVLDAKPDAPAKDAKHEGDKPVADGKKGDKGFLGKHKIWVFGLGGVALVVVFIMMKGKSSAAGSTSAAATPAIDPATGLPAGSAADLAALSAQAAQSASGGSGSAAGGGSADTSNIDPATGYVYGSPADIAALGASTATTSAGSVGSTAATGSGGGGGGSSAPAVPAPPVNGLAGESSPGTISPSGLVSLTYAEAQKLAGKSGSSSLYYSGPNTGGILHGQYANDKNVQYYTTSAIAKSKGV